MSLFQHFRTIGIVNDSVSPSLQTLGLDNFLTTSVGHTFHIYDCKKLKLISIGTPTPLKITHILSKGHKTIAAAGNVLILWERNEMKSFIKSNQASITSLTLLKSNQKEKEIETIDLISSDKNSLVIWAVKNGVEKVKKIELESDISRGCVIVPKGYKNKVLVGLKNGTVQLINTENGRKIYSFEKWGKSVVAMVSSNVKNVIAIAFDNGEVFLHNLKIDSSIVVFRHTENVSVMAFSNWNDGNDILATGVGNDINLWDLESRTLCHVISNAHSCGLSFISFINDSQELISSGTDNALKVWYIDPISKTTKLHKSRNGHSEPPKICRFYNDKRGSIISASNDKSLRLSSIIRDEHNTEFSQGKLSKKAKLMRSSVQNLKLPPVYQVVSNPNKEREMCNVLTAHENLPTAISWSLEKKSISRIKLDPNTDEKDFITAVAISTCGNVGITGSLFGVVCKHSLQTGSKLGLYVEFASNNTAHKDIVHCLEVTGLNSRLISGGNDGIIKFWDFKTRGLIGSLSIDYPITHMRQSKPSGLIAIASNDLFIRLIDPITIMVVRIFGPLWGGLNDMTFRPDGRWIVSASADRIIRVFDIPTGKLIDWFRFDSAATTIDFSHDGKFLLTASAESLGIQIWLSKSHFIDVVSDEVDVNVPPRKLSFYQMKGELDGVSNDEIVKTKRICGLISQDNLLEEKDYERRYKKKRLAENVTNLDQKVGENSIKPICFKEEKTLSTGENLVTFSDSSIEKWTNLAFIDAIKERNKPKEANIKTAEIPFFLSSEDIQGDIDRKEKIESLKNLSNNPEAFDNEFLELLRKKKNPLESTLNWLQRTNSSAIDLCLRTINSEDDLELVCEFFSKSLTRRNFFEVVQSALHVFLNNNSIQLLKCKSEHLNHLQNALKSQNNSFRVEMDEALALLQDSLDLNK